MVAVTLSALEPPAVPDTIMFSLITYMGLSVEAEIAKTEAGRNSREKEIANNTTNLLPKHPTPMFKHLFVFQVCQYFFDIFIFSDT